MSTQSLSKLIELAPEIEQWGRLTAEIFARIRMEAEKSPIAVPENEAWYWTENWQKREREADLDIAQGSVMEFNSAEACVSYLRK